jgi:hypothetical protein
VGRTRASGATTKLGRFLIVDSSTGGRDLMDKEPSDVMAGGPRSGRGNGRNRSGFQPRSAQNPPARPAPNQHVTSSESPIVGSNPSSKDAPPLKSLTLLQDAQPNKDVPPPKSASRPKDALFFMDASPEMWKPHFQRQQGTKHCSSAESHLPMTRLDTK